MTFWFDSGHIQPPEQTEIQSPEQARKSKTSAQKKIFHILYNVDNCKSSNNISAVVYNISEVFLHYMWGTVGSNVCKREGIIYIYISLVLNTVCGSTTVFCLFCDGCSRVPCLFWTVKLSTVLQKNPPRSADSSVFQHPLYIWTLSSSDYDFEGHLFTLRTIEGLKHNY